MTMRSFELVSLVWLSYIDKMPGTLGRLFESIRRPPSTSLDQLTDAEAAGPSKPAKQTTLLRDLSRLTPKNALTLTQAIGTLSSGHPINDRDLLLEHSIAMLQSLPTNSSMASGIANALIGVLWRDLPHPTISSCGPCAVYRHSDGSGNSRWNPDVGRAGAPYSRNVPPRKVKPPTLPDPELVFDQLLRRPERSFRQHPSGLNRMFFSFATIVIHECFQSNWEKPHINDTSSYLDLSTLYGSSQVEQDRVRRFEDGLLFPDTFGSDKIRMMPPGVQAICVLFSRLHNHVARRLREINEKGLYKDARDATIEELEWQDEDIFQLARNVTVAHFASAVMRDYISAILNTVRANSEWHLDLGGEIQQVGGSRLERGTGNVVSAEFNVMYRWHAALSGSDDYWMQDTLRKAFPDKRMDELRPEDMSAYVAKRNAAIAVVPPSEWTFGGLRRNRQGYFNDIALRELIKDLIEEPAHAFGARSTPASMRLVEVAGIKMAREAYNVCTLNEFRRYLNLTEYTSFLEWNPDREIAQAAERLYGHIDDLELYPGLVAEETKPAIPGSGVCPGHTTGRGLLDDAVSLVRGDRFLTVDFNSSTLTNWGVSQIEAVPGAYGGILPKLLFTALPGAWKGTSSYALLPFYTPKAVQTILADNGVAHLYTTDRMVDDFRIKGIYSYEGCRKAFEDRDRLETVYHDPSGALDPRSHFLLCSDDAELHDQRAQVLQAAFFSDRFEADVSAYFGTKVPELIHASSLAFRASKRRQIDIVRDVCNVAPILWLAKRFGIPLKTAEHPRGLISVPELSGGLLALFLYTSFNVMPRAEWRLRRAATEAGNMLAELLKSQIRIHWGPMEPLVDWLAKGTAYDCTPEAERLFRTLLKAGLSVDAAAWNCLHLMAAIAGKLTCQASLLIDFYLAESRTAERERIIELSSSTAASADEELLGYVLEGMRLAAAVPGVARRANRNCLFFDLEREIQLRQGDSVLIATSQASIDASVFPEPYQVHPRRPRDSYMLLGHGLHRCFGARLITPCLVSIVKEIFRLKNLRRAAGKAGELTKMTEEVGGTPVHLYLDRNWGESPIPTSMVVEFESEMALIPLDEFNKPTVGLV
ncbi:hypothetical protein ACQY0O_004949 [Thecaphora frezii]